MVALVVRAAQVADSHTTVAKTDLRLELRAMKQRVRGVSDTRGIVVSLI